MAVAASSVFMWHMIHIGGHAWQLMHPAPGQGIIEVGHNNYAANGQLIIAARTPNNRPNQPNLWILCFSFACVHNNITDITVCTATFCFYLSRESSATWGNPLAENPNNTSFQNNIADLSPFGQGVYLSARTTPCSVRKEMHREIEYNITGF